MINCVNYIINHMQLRFLSIAYDKKIIDYVIDIILGLGFVVIVKRCSRVG